MISHPTALPAGHMSAVMSSMTSPRCFRQCRVARTHTLPRSPVATVSEGVLDHARVPHKTLLKRVPRGATDRVIPITIQKGTGPSVGLKALLKMLKLTPYTATMGLEGIRLNLAVAAIATCAFWLFGYDMSVMVGYLGFVEQ